MSENAEKRFEWYVAHTYSGYENKVMDSLLKTVENNHMSDVIADVTIPIEEIQEIKNQKVHVIQQKIMPGYVFVRMKMTEEAWYVVRNTRGVTGFVGPDNKKPTPLSDEEYESIFKKAEKVVLEVEVGDEVKILTGLFENFTGTVTSIDTTTGKLTVTVPMLNRETTVELNADEVVKQG